MWGENLNRRRLSMTPPFFQSLSCVRRPLAWLHFDFVMRAKEKKEIFLSDISDQTEYFINVFPHRIFHLIYAFSFFFFDCFLSVYARFSLVLITILLSFLNFKRNVDSENIFGELRRENNMNNKKWPNWFLFSTSIAFDFDWLK